MEGVRVRSKNPPPTGSTTDASSTVASTTTSTPSTSPVAASSSSVATTTSEVTTLKTSVSVSSATNGTSTTSTDASSSSATTAPNKNLSAGAGVGIGIGTALFGALLALFVVWFIMKKRSAQEGGRRRRSHKSGGSGRSNEDENFIGARNDIILEDNLLQRADDSQIRKSLLDLNEVIDQHCENHYHLGSLGVNQHDLERNLVESGYNSFDVSGSSVLEFANLLHNTHSRLTAIRQLIAMVLFAHVDWRSTPDTSLLPPQISAFCQTIAPIEKQPGSKEIFERAFVKWRHLSAFLIEPFRSNRGTPKLTKEEVRAAIERNVALLNSVLKPFIKPGNESLQYQEANLAAIAFEIAQLGLLVFSQPSEWLFKWSVGVTQTSSGTGELRPRKSVGRDFVVFPGIGEVIDIGGERRLRVVAHPVLVRI